MPAITVAMRTEISQLYVSLFGRAPDGEGLGFWVKSYSDGNTLAKIAQSMYETAPARAYYPLFATPTEVVTTFYTNVLGRAPDAEGLAFWVKEYNASATQGAFFEKLISNVVNYNGTDAAGVTSKSLFSNKVAVAQYYGEQNGNVAGATAALNGVTAVAATVDTAKAAIVNTVVSGQTFTLTTGVDSSGIIKGDGGGTTSTAGNDTFLALVGATGANATDTLSATDNLDGGAGTTDTLNLTVTVTNTAALNAAQIKGIEIINVRAAAAGVTATVDASTAVGATQVNANQGPGAVTVTALAAGAAIGVIGNGTVTNGTTSYAYATATAAQTINVSGGVKGGNITATASAAVTTATINSTGAANTVGTILLASGAANTITSLTVNATTDLSATLTAADYSTTTALVVTGAGKLDIGANGNFRTVDASTSSGGLTMAIDTVTTSFKGSTANDTITTVTLAAPAAGIIDGGAGTSDKLVVAAAANVATAGLRSSYTNFEVLANSAGASIAASDFTGVTSVESSATGGSFTGLTASQAENVAVTATQGAVTYALTTATGTSDVLGLTLGTGLTAGVATSVTGGALTATGFETLNLKANPGPTASSGANRTSTIDSITDANLIAVNLTGTAFTFGDIVTSKAVAWNASALTGNGASTPVGLTLTTTGAAFAGSVVTGSDLRDSVIMNSSTGVTFNLGNGNDLFSTTSTLLLPSGAATDNTINAGAGTTDRFVITAAATLTDTHFTKVTGFEQLELAGGALNESATGLGAGFLSAFANGVSVTDTATQAAAQTFTWASGLYGQNVTLTHTSSGTLSAVDSNQSITTGSGNDTITLNMTAVVGAAGAAGIVNINTGSGNDTINVDFGTGQVLAVTGNNIATINGGAGQDSITINATRLNALAVNLGTTAFTIAAGQSTVSAADSITGFLVSAGTRISDTLDFGTSNLLQYTAAAPTGFSAAELTVAVSAVGAVTFAGTSAASLTLAQQVAAVQSVVTTAVGNTAYWANGGSTYVFNNDTAGDSLVQLVGVTGVTALVTTNQVAANAIHIA